jgi:hypothetical protein
MHITNRHEWYQVVEKVTVGSTGRWADIDFAGSWKNSRRGKCRKIAQNPQRPVHAVLARQRNLEIIPTPCKDGNEDQFRSLFSHKHNI